MQGEKVILGILITLVVFAVSALFMLPYTTDNYTGSSIEAGLIEEGKIIKVEAQVAYNLKIESCSPFTVKLDGEIEISGIPQEIDGTHCQSAYYKIEDSFDAQSIEIVKGSPETSITAETPVGLLISYPEEEANKAFNNVKIIAFLVWLLLMVGLWYL